MVSIIDLGADLFNKSIYSFNPISLKNSMARGRFAFCAVANGLTGPGFCLNLHQLTMTS